MSESMLSLSKAMSINRSFKAESAAASHFRHKNMVNMAGAQITVGVTQDGAVFPHLRGKNEILL